MTETKRPLWIDLWELSSDMVNCKECHAGQNLAHRELASLTNHPAPAKA